MNTTETFIILYVREYEGYKDKLLMGSESVPTEFQDSVEYCEHSEGRIKIYILSFLSPLPNVVIWC